MGKLEKYVISFFCLLFLLPIVLSFLDLQSGYWIRILSAICMLTSLTLALNILLGYTGYPAFGAVAFFGAGGYVTAVLMKDLSLPFILSFILGGLSSATLAFFLSPALMRLKSHYFAITTLALQLAFGELVANLEITGGSYGINLPIYRGFLENYFFYYTFWLLMVISFLLNLFVDRSVFGYALKAVREDEIAAESVGVNTTLFKSVSFSLMALIMGLCGGAYAYWITYIDPSSMFDPILSVKIFVALLLGGIGSTTGPVIGAFLLELISEIVWSKFLEIHGVILGAIIILIVLLLPRGVIGVRR